MSNGPARELKIDHSLQQNGEAIGDPYEISRIRKEDYELHKGKTEYEDLTQIQNKKERSRGHQSPAAFLIMGMIFSNFYF
jgi:leucyl aminopeptidase